MSNRYRKIPVEIEAREFTWDTIDEVAEWCGAEIRRTRVMMLDGQPFGGHRRMFINTLEGEMAADVGDWIIKGVVGEFYPIKAPIFHETYARIDP